jgi:hypothetical protein
MAPFCSFLFPLVGKKKKFLFVSTILFGSIVVIMFIRSVVESPNPWGQKWAPIAGEILKQEKRET